MKLWPVVTGVAIALTLVACKSPTPPKGVQPISGFDASRYLGKWYEVARLENRFERGLEQVTATYGQRSDGGISVLNRGYDPVKNKWNESEGKAYFTGAIFSVFFTSPGSLPAASIVFTASPLSHYSAKETSGYKSKARRFS